MVVCWWNRDASGQCELHILMLTTSHPYASCATCPTLAAVQSKSGDTGSYRGREV